MKNLGDCEWAFKGLWMPKEIIIDNRINWIEKGLATVIFNLDHGDGVTVSNEVLERLLCIKNRQVKALLSKLKGFGYINIDYEGEDRVIHTKIDVVVGGAEKCTLPYVSNSLSDSFKKERILMKENIWGVQKNARGGWTEAESNEVSEYGLIFKREYKKKYGIPFSNNGLDFKQKGQIKRVIDRMKKEGLDAEQYIIFCFSDNGYPPPKDSTITIGWITYRDSILKFLTYKGINHKPVSEYRKELAKSTREGTTVL